MINRYINWLSLNKPVPNHPTTLTFLNPSQAFRTLPPHTFHIYPSWSFPSPCDFSPTTIVHTEPFLLMFPCAIPSLSFLRVIPCLNMLGLYSRLFALGARLRFLFRHWTDESFLRSSCSQIPLINPLTAMGCCQERNCKDLEVSSYSSLCLSWLSFLEDWVFQGAGRQSNSKILCFRVGCLIGLACWDWRRKGP